MRRLALPLIAVAALALAGCPSPEPPKPPASPSPATSVSPATSPATSPTGSPVSNAGKVDSLVGRWSGPENTYLNIAKKGDKFTIEIANLDGPKSYEGTAKGDVIEFTRDGKVETVKTASGVETGMKGFEKETNCVVVTKGKEGFCKK